MRSELLHARYGAVHLIKAGALVHRLIIVALHLIRLLSCLLIGVAILLEALDTVVDLGASQAGQEGAGLDDANMHDGRIEFLGMRRGQRV